MINIMKQNQRTSIWYGDIDILEKCAKVSGVLKSHPQNTIQCILNALDKSPNFIKTYIYSDISGKKRKYRCFTMIASRQ